MKHNIHYYYYKGYFATVNQAHTNAIFSGKIHGMDHSFNGKENSLKMFHDAVDAYLLECQENDIVPKPGIVIRQVLDLKSDGRLQILLEYKSGIRPCWHWSIQSKTSLVENFHINFVGFCSTYKEASDEAKICWDDIKLPIPATNSSFIDFNTLNISSSLRNCLKRFFVENPEINDIQEVSRKALLGTRNFGKGRMAELIKALEAADINSDWLKN